MKTIGILFLGDSYYGGSYQYTISMIEALLLDNKRKYVLFTYLDNTDFDESGIEIRQIHREKTIFHSAKILRLIRYYSRLLYLYLNIRKPVFFSQYEKEIFQDIDFFISPAIYSYPQFYLNKPYICTLHDLQEKYYPGFFSHFELIIRNINNKSILKNATHIICESNYVKADIIKFFGIEVEKIDVLPAPPTTQFLDIECSENTMKAIKLRYNLPDEYIFYPAQFWYHKNHLRLLEAFKIIHSKYANIHLILTGSKQNNYKNIIEKIDVLNLNDNVHYLGYINYNDLPIIYKMSKMLIMATLFESISIPIYEAFSLKVPVCASNVVALPEQVGDSGLLFNPTDINDIAIKIEMLLIDEELAQNLARKGYEKMQNFNCKHYSEKLIEIVNNAI